MTPNKLAHRAYQQAAAPTKTPGKMEYDVVARVTFKLKEAAKRGKRGFPQLAEAIHENRAMWTIFATDVASDGNELPQELRAQIFYLAEFTQHHSAKVLSGDANVRPLLEVNAPILRGLRNGAAAA